MATRWKLQAEAATYTSDPAENLELNGATPEEVEFLRGNRTHAWSPKRYTGKRVELNAFTSDQFVEWLESKLKQQKIRKVVPDDETLDQAYRRAASIRRYQEIIGRAEKEVSAYAAGFEVPKNLKKSLGPATERGPATSLGQDARGASAKKRLATKIEKVTPMNVGLLTLPATTGSSAWK